MKQVDKSVAELAFQADSGDAEAQYCMGLIFLLGESVDQDLDAAYKWMARAASGQHAGAKSLAAKLLLTRSPIGGDEPASRPGQIIEKAASLSTAFLLSTKTAVIAALRKTLLWCERQAGRLAAKVHFEARAEFPDFPARRTEGFEFPEVS